MLSIEKLEQKINKDGGFTINRVSGIDIKAKKGFMVSITNNRAIDIKKALSTLYKVKIEFKGYRLYIGGWKSDKDGFYYIDYSIRVKNREIALKMAILFNQMAIYDLEDKTSIDIK